MDKIKLGDLCIPSAGQIKEDADELIDYIDISSVDNETKKVTGFQTMSFGESPSRARKAVKKGSILVSTVRPNLNAVAMLEEDTPNISVASTGFCILDCKDNVDNRFVFNFCKSKTFIDDMVSQATGASYPAVSDKIVRSALVPNYTYEEQCNISEILDKVSKVIEDRKAELLALDDLIKARFVELFGDPVAHLDRGETVKLDTIADKITVGFVGEASNEYADEGVPYLRTQNVRVNRIDLNGLIYVNESFHNKNQKSIIHPGDVVISRVGVNRGMAAMVPDSLPEANIANCLIVGKNDNINSYYLAFYMNMSFGKRPQFGASVGSAQGVVNTSILKKWEVYVPDRQMQDDFFEFAKQVDKSKVAVQKALDEAQLLFDSLMQQYFG